MTVIDAVSRWREWAMQQVCEDCGAAFKDRRPGDRWAAEELCWPCFEKRCGHKKKEDAMQIDVGITQEKDDALTVTLRGEVGAVIEVLVHGFTEPALMQIRDAFERELAGRGPAPKGQEPGQ